MSKYCHASLFAFIATLTAACSGSEPPRTASYGCAELGDAVRAAAPFYEGRQVHAARPIQRTVSRTKAFENRQLAGAELDVYATPYLTAEYLQRALVCHAAGAQEIRPNDPLRPGGPVDEIAVRSTGAGFTVSVTSHDSATAREIWQRSQLLAGEGASVDVRPTPKD